MPIICVYLDTAQALNAAHHEFNSRLRTELGMRNKVSSLGPHVTIKAPIDFALMNLRDAHARIATFARTKRLSPVTARVLPPAEFSIMDSDATVLHLPFDSTGLTGFMTNVLDFFENEFHLERKEHEGKNPHLTLVRELFPERRQSVLSVARSIAWPKEVVFGTIVIAHCIDHGKENQEWHPYGRIPLYRGP